MIHTHLGATNLKGAQRDHSEIVNCEHCGQPARIAVVLTEEFDKPKAEGGQYISGIHEYDEDNYWIHDLCSIAVYVCTNSDCRKATTHIQEE